MGIILVTASVAVFVWAVFLAGLAVARQPRGESNAGHGGSSVCGCGSCRRGLR